MTTSQIFKTQIPNEKIFDLFDKICIKINNYYIFDDNSFKVGLYHKYIQHFLEDCKPYYYISKRKYLERTISNATFSTIIRQICNHNKIKYNNQIKYNKSQYDIIYFIYCD